MKKITLFFAAVVMAVSASAQGINNPPTDNSHYSFWYNCATSSFVTNAEPETDQTFTFAVDVAEGGAGQPLLNYLAGQAVGGTPAETTGDTRSVAAHIWVSASLAKDLRLTHITGNIYGADINLKQLYGASMPAIATTVGGNGSFSNSTTADLITNGSFVVNLIFLGYSVGTTPTNGEWAWGDTFFAADGNLNTGVYTGTNTYPTSFTAPSTQVNAGMAGIALPCTLITAVQSVIAADKVVSSVDLFSILGEKLPSTAKGLVIKKTTYTDGTSASVKLILE
jgi:hypothetical protein